MKWTWILGLGVALAGCGRSPAPPATANLPPVTAQIGVVSRETVPDIHEAVGTVRPTVTANVSPKVMATIEKLHVRPGDTVTNGQVLAELDDRDLRAEFDRAKADFERVQSLVEKGVATRAEFDAVHSRYRIAEANLSYAKLLAPFPGLVTQKLGDAGDLATPGRPLLVVEQLGQFRLEASVPERFAAALALGKEVEVVVDALHGRCTGPIDEIIPAADPASRSFLIKIKLKGDKPLKTGLFGRALLPVGTREVLLVPATAVRTRGQLTYVYVSEAGTARMRLVRPGRIIGEQVEVLSGLQPGERVVLSSAGELSDGQPLQ